MTDVEIIGKIKADVMLGLTSGFLTLDIVELDDDMWQRHHVYSKPSMDAMFAMLFDMSLSKTIHSVDPRVVQCFMVPSSKQKNPIVGYTFNVIESKDHQTNITPRLMKFLDVVMREDGIRGLMSGELK